MFAPLPKSVRELLDDNTHPGLALDKYARTWSDAIAVRGLAENTQRPAVDEVSRLSRSAPPASTSRRCSPAATRSSGRSRRRGSEPSPPAR